MRFIDAGGFTADRPWVALDIAETGQATVRLQWTDQPYVWHVNDGPEVLPRGRADPRDELLHFLVDRGGPDGLVHVEVVVRTG